MDIPILEDDADRVAALRAYGILDSAPEQAFDDITELLKGSDPFSPLACPRPNQGRAFQ